MVILHWLWVKGWLIKEWEGHSNWSKSVNVGNMGVYINRVCIAIIINFQFKINSINSINLFNYNLFDSMATATTATAPSSARPITSHKQLVRNVLLMRLPSSRGCKEDNFCLIAWHAPSAARIAGWWQGEVLSRGDAQPEVARLFGLNGGHTAESLHWDTPTRRWTIHQY